MTSKWRKVLDEVGDQISGSTYIAIRNIDSNERRIAALEERVSALEEQSSGGSDSGQTPEPEAEPADN